MAEGFTSRHLQRFSGLSASTIQRIIHHWLAVPPAPVSMDLSSCRYLIFDGTFLFRRRGIVTVMDAALHRVICGQYGVHENSQPQLQTFFTTLKDGGLNPIGCTIDGNPQVMRVLKNVWPNITLQRCLVHIQRQGLMWCRRKPSRYDAQRLRQIFLKVTSIRTSRERDTFLADVYAWEERYGSKLAQIPERGWVISDLKRARSMLLKALPHMFHYLENPAIATTTNGLEGYFARLKNHYRQHRGLAPSQRQNYFAWYFHLKPR